MKTTHYPVLLDQVIQVLNPKQGELYLDGTAGYGGHAAAILDRIGDDGHMILLDRDISAIKALGERFGDRAELIHDNYLEGAERLRGEGVIADMILLDLGFSSPQVDNAERGFSFKADGPLDMRMDQSQGLTAGDIVNGYALPALEGIIRDFGGEPRARAVAKAIIAARPIESTARLAKIVRHSALVAGDIDPATRTFQAIRIAVNDELGQLRQALPVLVQLLALGGRIAVISFHSLEDRIVKQFFDQESRDCICPPKQPVCTCGHAASLRKVTTKAMQGDSDEIAFNPRARSAKLRAAEKINKNKRRD